MSFHGLMVCVSLIGAALISVDAVAQNYPHMPIRMLTGLPGGDDNFVARVLAKGLSGSLGQQVIVDNRPSSLSGEIVAKAAPDGYTLLATGWMLWLRPLLQTATYDPVKDFSPITVASQSHSVLTVHPSLPVNSVRDLIALAMARPGDLNYGTGPAGTTPHLAAELFKFMARVHIVRVNYKGGGLALNAPIANQLHLMFNAAPSVAGHIKAGRLKALAVTSTEPSALFPGTPTISGSGVPGYELMALDALFAPAGTPVNVNTRLNQEFANVLRKPEVRERFLDVGVEVVASAPQVLASVMKSDIARLGEVIRSADIRAD